MAIVQYTGIVNQLRGKLNGSVFNRYRTGYSMQKKQQPPQGFRGNQLRQRAVYSVVQRLWKTLTPSQHNAWATTAAQNPATDRFGNQVTLSGYNQYIKASLFLYPLGSIINPDGFPAPAPTPGDITWEVTDMSIAADEFGDTIFSGHLDASYTADPAPYMALLDVSLPQSTGVTVYTRGWRALFRQAMLVPVDSAFSANLGNRYPIAMPGARLFMRFRIIHYLSGAVVYTETQAFTIPTAPTIPTWEVTYNGNGVPSDVAIAYDPASIGVPPFYQLRVYFSPGMVDPPTPEQTNTLAAGVTDDLQAANTAQTFITLTPGRYMGWKVELIFSQSGAVVATAFDVIQNV